MLGFKFGPQAEAVLLESAQSMDRHGVVIADITTIVYWVRPTESPFPILNTDVSAWRIQCVHAKSLNMKRLVIHAEMLTRGRHPLSLMRRYILVISRMMRHIGAKWKRDLKVFAA